MTLEQAWREHAAAKKRFRKEVVNGNVELAQEHWARAETLWKTIGSVIKE